MKGSDWMTTRERMTMEQDYAARREQVVRKEVERVKKEIGIVEEAKWDNESFDPSEWRKDYDGEDDLKNHLFRGPRVSDLVQMVIENRDSPEPEVRPFLITQVLDASTGLVNGMLFMANSDIRQGEAGILGGGMSQAIRQAGFVVPEAVKGVFWLDRVRFHPRGLPRQQTQMVEKKVNVGEIDNDHFEYEYKIVEEPLWDGKEPLLEATWRWAQ